MAYSINFTDAVNKGSITVEDNSVNNDTSIQFPGKSYTGYGAIVNTNFLHMLENFANNNAPGNPVEGQLWYDNTSNSNSLKIYDGTTWVNAGGVKKGASEPSVESSNAGDLWVNTTTQQLYLYSGSGWLLIGPSSSSGTNTGARNTTIIDITDVEQQAIINYVNNVPVSIIVATEFTPKSVITGFSVLKPGVNVSTNLSGTAGKFYGTSTNAENLLVSGNPVDGTKFVRNDEPTVTQYPFTIRNNTGVEIGTIKTLALGVEGTNAIISQQQSTGFLDIRTNNDGTTITPIRIKANGNIGILNPDPEFTLDIVGDINATGNISNDGTLDTNNTNITGTLDVTGNTTIGGTTTISGSIIADTNAAYNIGSATGKFNAVYANRFVGEFEGNITGNVDGSVTTALEFRDTTTFNIEGHVQTSTGVTYDGRTGGYVKTFTTTATNDIIADQTTITLQDTDEFLINRPGLGLRKTTRGDIVGEIPTMPIGMIVPYAGFTAPDGWFLCDGSEVSLLDYSALASVMGYDAGDNNTWYWGTPSDETLFFVLPDLRGRFAMGIGSASASTGNRIHSADPANAINIMGGNDGNQSAVIDIDNLPEHTHKLENANGDTFFATSLVDESADGDTDAYSQQIGTNGSGISKTGGVDNSPLGSAMDITNPFVAVNYIIYHGVHS
jgi:microcystin-dependent protein